MERNEDHGSDQAGEGRQGRGQPGPPLHQDRAPAQGLQRASDTSEPSEGLALQLQAETPDDGQQEGPQVGPSGRRPRAQREEGHQPDEGLEDAVPGQGGQAVCGEEEARGVNDQEGARD